MNGKSAADLRPHFALPLRPIEVAVQSHHHRPLRRRAQGNVNDRGAKTRNVERYEAPGRDQRQRAAASAARPASAGFGTSPPLAAARRDGRSSGSRRGGRVTAVGHGRRSAAPSSTTDRRPYEDLSPPSPKPHFGPMLADLQRESPSTNQSKRGFIAAAARPSSTCPRSPASTSSANAPPRCVSLCAASAPGRHAGCVHTNNTRFPPFVANAVPRGRRPPLASRLRPARFARRRKVPGEAGARRGPRRAKSRSRPRGPGAT